MPELPEVETLRLGLEKYLVGHRIVDVEVKLARIVQGDIKNIIGASFIGVRRFGKGLVIDLDNDYSIAIHIKLTGQLIYRKVAKETEETKGTEGLGAKVKVIKAMYATLPNKWTHVIFKLDNKSVIARSEATKQSKGDSRGRVKRDTQNDNIGAVLYYNDFRQFGWIKIVKTDKVGNLPFFKELGPEFPIGKVSPHFAKASRGKEVSQGETLRLEKFIEIVEKSKLSIKPLIMDQKKMSGIGNIYANDSLNLAKIDPSRKANTLSAEEIKMLYEALEIVLKKGLETGGASELSYVNVLGEEGGYQKHFITYARDGKPCKNCGTILKKIMLGGRGTYYCPACQR